MYSYITPTFYYYRKCEYQRTHVLLILSTFYRFSAAFCLRAFLLQITLHATLCRASFDVFLHNHRRILHIITAILSLANTSEVNIGTLFRSRFTRYAVIDFLTSSARQFQIFKIKQGHKYTARRDWSQTEADNYIRRALCCLHPSCHQLLFSILILSNAAEQVMCIYVKYILTCKISFVMSQCAFFCCR